MNRLFAPLFGVCWSAAAITWVSEAASVQEAESNYSLDEFDLIISDLRLPGAPGTDLIKKAGSVPVLIMTSYASLRSAVDSMRMGAVDYIAKPFDHNDMVSAVQRDHRRSPGPARGKPPPGRKEQQTRRISRWPASWAAAPT